MKIVQTFWTARDKSPLKNYGWYAPQYHWMSWLLSSTKLHELYENVVLYTDEIGYEILINKLGASYSEIYVVLDELTDIPPQLWAVPKIITYSLQEESFIHFDGDVFIWEKFNDRFVESQLLVQNKELPTNYYDKMWESILPHLSYIPKELKDFRINNKWFSYNVGIIGGNDLSFIKEYAREALLFVNNNRESWDNIAADNFNIFFEQLLLYSMAEHREIETSCLFSEVIEDNGYVGFDDFDLVPNSKTYLHLIGDYKRSEYVCKKMEQFCLHNYPEILEKINVLIPNTYNYHNFNYHYISSENESTKRKYLENLTKNNKVLDTLLYRDIYTFDSYTKYLKMKENDIFYLLPEIDIVREKPDSNYVLYVREERETRRVVKELDNIDVFLLSLLEVPITKRNFFLSVRQSLHKLGSKNLERIEKIANNLIVFFLKNKVLIVLSEVEWNRQFNV